MKLGFHGRHVERFKTTIGVGLGDFVADVVIVDRGRLRLFDEKVDAM